MVPKVSEPMSLVVSETLPARMVAAVIAGEDAKFCAHSGFDAEAIEKAMERDNFMTAIEAKDFGLIDQVFDKRPVPAEDA